ncbi:MAG: acyl-CoA thioesterase [Sphaerochaetaceae bacterium]|nr:acyl-CoA thioesterase [Sphaerochaetaceae bacterium]
MFTYTRKANYHETDKMGIIHHSNYIKWMEEARIEYMQAIGFGFEKVEEAGIMSPVAGISIDYKKPVSFGDIVEVRISITRYSGVVQEVSYEFFNSTKQEVCAQAISKHCYINKEGRVVNLKKVLPQLDALFSAEFNTADSL